MLRWVIDRNSPEVPRKTAILGYVLGSACIMAAPIALFIDPLPAGLVLRYMAVGAMAGLCFVFAEDAIVELVGIGVFIFGVDAVNAAVERADPTLVIEPWHSALVPGAAMFAVLLFPAARACAGARMRRILTGPGPTPTEHSCATSPSRSSSQSSPSSPWPSG